MTDNEIFESNLLSFEIMKRYGAKAQCRCPAHDDKHASLTITKGRKRYRQQYQAEKDEERRKRNYKLQGYL
ncbi:MAG: hypothetical protein NC489_39735 [Ruminococcus flavefaciens]|nr:hypothetical protein [Ruminococcus flavefaciens]